MADPLDLLPSNETLLELKPALERYALDLKAHGVPRHQAAMVMLLGAVSMARIAGVEDRVMRTVFSMALELGEGRVTMAELEQDDWMSPALVRVAVTQSAKSLLIAAEQHFELTPRQSSALLLIAALAGLIEAGVPRLEIEDFLTAALDASDEVTVARRDRR